VDSPAYADLDWKMALSGEVEGVKLVEETEGKDATDNDAQAVLETSEMVEEAPPAQDETPPQEPVETNEKA
jgi:hypothetical protein